MPDPADTSPGNAFVDVAAAWIYIACSGRPALNITDAAPRHAPGASGAAARLLIVLDHSRPGS